MLAYDQRGFGKTGLDKNRSKTSSYGKTSTADQVADAEFFIKHARARVGVEGIKTFLVGHSMVRSVACLYHPN